MRLSLLTTTAIVLAESLGGYAYPMTSTSSTLSSERVLNRRQPSPPTSPRQAASPQRDPKTRRKPSHGSSDAESPSTEGTPTPPAQQRTQRVTRSKAKGGAGSPKNLNRVRGGVRKPSTSPPRVSSQSASPSRASPPRASTPFDDSVDENGFRRKQGPYPEDYDKRWRQDNPDTPPKDITRERTRENEPKEYIKLPQDLTRQRPFPPPKSIARIAMEAHHGNAGQVAKVTSFTEERGAPTLLLNNPSQPGGGWAKGQDGGQIQHASGPLAAGAKHTTNGPGSMCVEAHHSIDFGVRCNPGSQGAEVNWRVDGFKQNWEKVLPGDSWTNSFDNDLTKGPFVMDISHTGGTAWVKGRMRAEPKPKPSAQGK